MATSKYRQDAMNRLMNGGNTTTTNTGTAYQQNLANVQTPAQPEFNTRRMLGTIYDIAKVDRNKAGEMMSMFQTLQQDKTSKYYNPYSAPTNRAVQNLAAYGVDTSIIDDQFFQKNNYLMDYLIYDGTTNTPTKPGKKASAAQKAAYEYYQIWKSEEATKKTEQQWNALQEELKYWAGRKDLNYSDDEIIGKIDWSKYKALTDMDEKKYAQPPEYNRAIGYSKDALYGILWEARNPDYNGDIYGAMANSYNGIGNVWQNDPEIKAKRTPGTEEFNPYSLGSVGIDDACVYYNASGFDRNWLNEHQADAFSNDETRKKMYNAVYNAVENTEKATEAVDALNRWIDKKADGWGTEERAQKKLDEALAKGKIIVDGKEYDISILNKIDASIGKKGNAGSGNMVATTGAINYKYDSLWKKIQQIVADNQSKKDGEATLESMNDPAPVADVMTGAQEALMAGTKTDTAAVIRDANEVKAEAKVRRESGKTLAQQAKASDVMVSQEEAAKMLFGSDAGADAIAAAMPSSNDTAQKEIIKAQTAKIIRTADVLETVMSPNERKYIKNLPGINGTQLTQAFAKAVNGTLMNGPVSVELADPDWAAKMATKKSVDAEKEYLNTCFESLALRTKYEATEKKLMAAQEKMNVYNGEYAEKLRSLEEIPEQVDIQLDDYSGLSISFVQDSRGNYVLSPYFDMSNPALESYMAENGMTANDLMGEINQEKKRLNQNAASIRRAKEKYPELTEEEISKLPTQQDINVLNAQIASMSKYVEENRAAYDEASKAVSLSGDKRNIIGSTTLSQSGFAVDPAISDNVINYVQQFTDYEVPEEAPISLIEDLRNYYGDRRIQTMDYSPESAKEEITSYLGDIDDQIANAEYVLDHYQLPELYQNNINNYVQYMKQQKRLYNDYLTVLDEDYEDLVSKGKEIYWQNHISTHDSEEANMEANKTGWGLMSDYEKDLYYALCAKQGVEAADQYYQDIEGSLLAQAKYNLEAGAEEMAQKGFFGRAFNTLVSIGSAPLDVLSSIVYTAQTALTGKGDKWTRVPAYASKAASTAVQQEIKNLYKDSLFGKIASGFWEIANNRGRSAITGATFGWLFPEGTSDIVHAFPIAFTAAGEALETALDNDLSLAQAFGLATVTFLAESVTEGIELGHMKNAFNAGSLGSWKEFWMSRIPDALSEMLGESTNDFVERAFNTWIAGDKSDRAKEIQTYIDAGYLPDDAEMMVYLDEFKGILHTALISAISPLADVGAYGLGRIENTLYYAQLVDQQRRIGDSTTTIRDLRNRDVQFMKSQQELSELELKRELRPFYANEKKAAKAETAKAETAETETAKETETTEAEEAENAVAETAEEEAVDEEEYIDLDAEGPQEAVLDKDEKDDYDRSILVIANAENSDRTTRTAAIAGALDIFDSLNHEVTAGGVASELISYYGSTDIATHMVMSLLNAGKEMGYAPFAIKQAIQFAMLTDGECSKMFHSEAYAMADPQTKAKALMQALTVDMTNPTISAQVEAATRELRGVEAQKPVMATTDADERIEEAENKAAEAREKANDAAKRLDTQKSVEQAKAESLDAAAEEATANPSKENTDAVVHATQELDNESKVTDEYTLSKENADRDVATAEEEAEQTKGKVMTDVRQQAEQIVAQQDVEQAQAQEAAKVQAEQEAEAARLQAEEQAKAQAEEDQRTGKAQEQEQFEMIDKYVDSLATDPETRERLRTALKERQVKKNTGNIDLSKRLTDAEAMLALGAFQRKLGVPIVFADDLGPANGKYKDGVIYLNAQKARDGSMRLGQALVETALHEITHGLEQTQHYKAYRDVVLGTLYGFGDDFDAEKLALDIKRKQQAYARNGVELSEPDAEKEIIADFARMHLSEKETIQRLMDAGLAGRMRNMLHNINQALRNFFGKLTGEDRTMAENLRKAERAFQKAMNERAQTTVHPSSEQFSIAQFAQATNMTYDEKTQTLYNQRGEKVDGVKVKVTRQDVAQTPVGKLIDIGLSDNPVTDADGNVRYLTEADGTPVLDENGNPVVMTQKNAALEMFSGLMNMVAMLKDQNLVWEIAGSALESTFSALKSNSDTQYHDTIDFGTICAKTQAIVNVMSNVMLDRLQANKQAIKEGRPQDVSYGLTREDVLKIYNETHKAGLSVPCPVCYVFSRWMGVPSLLGSMSRFQHDYVDAEYDADGNLVLDENGYAKFNRETTQKKANEYIRKMHEKYTDKDGVNDRKTKVTKEIEKHEDKHVKIASEIETIKGQLEQKNLTEKKRTALEEKLKSKEAELIQNARETTELDEELRELEAYNWITQALFKQVKHKNEEGKQVTENVMENGEYIIDPDFQITPDEVLMDMRRTGEFADRYEKNWAYRTSRGAGMGKTILPYSGASLGDILLGSKTRVASDQNPFFTGYDNGKAAKKLEEARERARRQNLIGGQRLQSTSDFRPEWGLDYIMAFLELQAAQSNAQMYTKVVEAVDLFASAGADVNLSIMGQGQGYHEATPEEIALAQTDTEEGRELQSRMGVGKDGKTYVLDFSSVTGMDYNAAKAKTKKYDNAQMILVGMNDQHIRLAMANGDIDFIIPWHSSGNSRDVLSQLVASVEETLETSSDYTSVQTDGFIQKTEYYTDENGKRKSRKVDARTKQQKDAWSARIKILTGIAENEIDQDNPEKGGLTEDEWEAIKEEKRTGNGYLMDLYRRFYVDKNNKCYHVALTASQAKQIFPYEYWQTDPSKSGGTKETADENGLRFIAYCQALGITPRFSGKMDKKTKKESANFAGAIFDQKTGDIVGYDPTKMDKGYWKLLIDRKMYGNDGQYREQRTIDTSRIDIGSVDDQGRISDDSMLPREASAKYGIASLEQQAARASERIIEKPFDLESSGQDGQMLYADDFTEADLDEMLADAGIEQPRDISEIPWEDILTDEDYEDIEHDLFGERDEDEEEEVDTREVITAVVEDLKDEFDPTIFGGRLYVKPETMDYWLSGSGFAATNPVYAQAYITMMNPADFLRATTTRPEAQQQILDESTPLNEGRLAENAERQPIQLIIDEATGKIIGHEGRHRAVALARAGVKQMPVLLFDSSTKYSKTPKAEMTLEGQDPAFDRTVRNGNTITFTNVVPLNQEHREEIVKRFTASDEERQTAEALGQRLVQYSMDGNEYTEADLDDMLRQAGIKSDEPIHNTREAAYMLGWKFRRVKGGTTVVFDENGNRIGTMNGNQITVDTGNPKADEYMEALNRVMYAPEDTGAGLEGTNPDASSPLGTAVRTFAADGGMLDKSDELDRFAQTVVKANRTYFPDTNAEQIQRAIQWIRSLKATPTSDGFAEAFQEVMRPSFDYRSADGQARMVAVMAMANAKNDVVAQTALNDAFMRQGTDLGRALQARKLYLLMTPDGRQRALDNMLTRIDDDLNAKGRKHEPLKLSDWIYQAAAVAEDPKDFERVRNAAAAELAEQLPATWGERIVAWRMLSMLSAPKTHLRNVAGNLMNVPVVGAKNKVGALIEIIAQKTGILDKKDRTKTIGLANPEARAFSRDRVKSMQEELQGNGKFKEGSAVQQEKKYFGTRNGPVSKTVGKVLQAWYDANGRMLEWEDWLFLKGHYQRALAGFMTARGLKPADMTGKTLEEADAYAIKEAKKATYRDESAVANWLNRIGTQSKNSENSKALSFIQWLINTRLPFKRTPINIAKRGVEYSVAGLGKSIFYDSIHLHQYNQYQRGKLKTLPNGAISPSEWIDRFASGLTGTGIMLAGALARAAGLAGAGFKKDDPDDEIDKLAGDQEYSIKPIKLINNVVTAVGKIFDPDYECELLGEDVSTTMDWAVPTSLPFFSGVAMYDYFVNHGISVGGALDLVMEVTEPMMNMSFMSGVNDMLKNNNYSNKDTVWQFLEKTGINFVTSLIPTWAGQIASTVDGRRTTYRAKTSLTGDPDIDKMIQQIGNKLPWLNLGGIQYTNEFGEVPENVIPAFVENIFSPAYLSRVDESDEINELRRVYKADPENNKRIVPSTPKNTIRVNGKDVELTGEEYTELKAYHGSIWRETVNSVIDNPLYQMCTNDDSKADMLNLADEYATQIAKWKMNNDYKVDSWAMNAYNNGTADEEIINKVAQSNKSQYVKAQTDSFADSLYRMDQAGIAKFGEELQSAHANPSDVRERLTSYFKPLYIEALKNEDEDSAEMIVDILSDINEYVELDEEITSYTYGRDFNKWAKSAGLMDDEDIDVEEDEDDEDNNDWLNMNKQAMIEDEEE